MNCNDCSSDPCVCSPFGGRVRTVRDDYGWIGVDFDGTLAHYERWKGPTHAGDPIPKMAERVRDWLREGKVVKIFTARIYPIAHADNTGIRWVENYESAGRRENVKAALVTIQQFCLRNFGVILPVTCVKDFGMVELYDDRAFRVEQNTGEILSADKKPAENFDIEKNYERHYGP